MSDYSYLLDLAVILLCTKLLGLATRKVQMPQVVGALMAGLELGDVTYQQWVKFSWKIIALLVALGAVFSLVAQAIGLS